MKQTHNTLLRKALVAGLTALLFAPAMPQAVAAPGTLAQMPLYVGPAVEPNIVFVADDSGSMDWAVITPETEGLFYLDGLPYYYTHPAPGNLYHWVVASQEYLESEHGLTPEVSGVWRARTHHYNTAYYNPGIDYRSWIGHDKNGNPFVDADPRSAWVNPYDPDAGTVDLTDPNTSFATDHPDVIGGFTVTNFYPARYYAIDAGHSGPIEKDTPHKLVEITSSATAMTSSPPATFPGGANRADCAAITECTYAEEIQNFANWFSYHRNRDLIAKNAAAQALRDISGARVGYATINNNDNVRIPVGSIGLDPDTGHKRDLLDRIYRTRPAGETPLRNALDRTGRYFECASNNIMGTGTSNCPILPASEGGTCQSNYTVLMTDGYWNGPAPSGIGNADGDNNTVYDGWPFADSHPNTLADVAMHYYERDLAPHLENDVPTAPGQRLRARHQHMVTHTAAFGVSGTLDPQTDDPWASGFNWPNPAAGDREKIDDLWHAAFNGRGDYFNAMDPLSLGSGLKTVFQAVTVGRSTSASVAFNTTRLGTDSMLYQASFNPSQNWSGDLNAIHLDLSGQLAGLAWSAADRLDQRDPNSRLVLTWNDDEDRGVPFRTLANLSGRQIADLHTGPGGASDGLGQQRLDYLRGDRINEGSGGLNFRIRSNVLGDIVYSNPVFVGRPEMAYEDEITADDLHAETTYSHFRQTHTNRTPVIYVGANDGMLHGFRASDGQALISYVPNRLFSDQPNEGLHYLTNPAYSHRYYVDLSPTISDIRLGGAWRTVLVGGYRAGGRGLFALDITNPGTFSEADAENIVLWEFTDEDDANLGHSFSKPTIARMADGRFAAIFGNGYNDLGDGQARLYILYFDGEKRVITTGVGTTANRNGLSTPAIVDSTGDGRADRAYAGDLRGNLWAFDLTGTGSVAFSQGGTPRPLFRATTPGGTAQPITSKPVVARNPTVTTANNNRPNILVFFGTGQFIVEGDRTSTDTQTFYGVWDNGGNSNFTRTNLVQQSVTADSTADLRVTTQHTFNYNNTNRGWYLDLPTTGERVVVDPRVRGDFVFFNTLIPDPGTCNSQGFGWLMTLDLAFGRGPQDPVFDINNDGEVNDGDLVNGEFPPSGVRMDGIPAGSNFLSDIMYTPDDSGNIDIRRVNTGIQVDSGRLSWREVRQ